MKPNVSAALRFFAEASDYARRADLAGEIACHRSMNFRAFSETDLLRESAWVILCSGFRESVVQRCFDHISLCYCDWESAPQILSSARACRLAALAVFRNESKLQAIVGVAQRVATIGFSKLKQLILAAPIPELTKFPYIGPVTALHLAKNLGMDVVKPDRHLLRISAHFGFRTPSHLCAAISKAEGEAPRIVDLVLWRYMADTKIRRLPSF